MKHDQQVEQALSNTRCHPEFRDMRVAGRQLHYVQLGDASERPTVALLHGSPGTFEHFTRLLANSSLAKSANLLAIDRPGFGGSDFGQVIPDLQAQAELLSHVLREHRTARMVLVGHSFGSPVAARLAMDCPELVDHLLLLSPALDPDAGASWYRWLPVLNTRPLRWFFSRGLQLYAVEALAHPHELREMSPLWSRLTIPVTVLHGDQDKNVPVANAHYVRDKLTNSPRVDIQILPGINHDLLWVKQELICRVLLGMLDAT